MSFMKSLGQYLKDSYDNGSGLYSALFVTSATIGIGVSFGVAGILALGSSTAIPLFTAGATAIALGAYAGAPAIAEFSHGIKNAFQGEKTLSLKNYNPAYEPAYESKSHYPSILHRKSEPSLQRSFSNEMRINTRDKHIHADPSLNSLSTPRFG